MPSLSPSTVTPLFPLRRPITNVTVREFMSHRKFTLEVSGQYSGEVNVPNSDCKEFVVGVLADTNRDIGYVFGGIVTWRSDPRHFNCTTVVDEDGNVFDVDKLRE